MHGGNARGHRQSLLSRGLLAYATEYQLVVLVPQVQGATLRWAFTNMHKWLMS